MKEELASPAVPFARILCHLFLLKGRSPCNTFKLWRHQDFSSHPKEKEVSWLFTRRDKKYEEAGEGCFMWVRIRFLHIGEFSVPEVSCCPSAGWLWGGMRCLLPLPSLSVRSGVCMCLFQLWISYLEKDFPTQRLTVKSSTFFQKKKACLSSIEQM